MQQNLWKAMCHFWMSHVNSYRLHVLWHIKAVIHLPGGR